MSQKQITEERVSSQIKFPAVRFDDGFVTVLTGSVTRASRLGLKKGSYKKAVIVDASGARFQIVGMGKKRTLLSWRFGQILELVSGNPSYEVEWTFGPPSRISLEDVKELFLKSFNKERDYWDEMIDFDEFRAKIVATSSFDQLFAVLREFHMMS